MQQWNPPEYGYSLVKEQHDDLRRQAALDRMSKTQSAPSEPAEGQRHRLSLRRLFHVLARGHHLHLAPHGVGH